jgi:uncharacterized protein (DUF1778 family)
MARASARLEFRVTPAHKAMIERAAQLSGEPVTAFARDAAEERAERVLREHEATTVVPAEFFDDLMMALDATPRPNPVLVAAGERLRETISRD